MSLTTIYLTSQVALIPPTWPFVWPVQSGTAYTIVDQNLQPIGMLVQPAPGCVIEVENPPYEDPRWYHFVDHAFVWRGGQVDANADGYVNGIDFELFTAWFEAGGFAADFNCDGFVNGDDFDTFSAAWVAGGQR